MSLPLLHAGRTNPGLSAQLDLRFALDKSLTAYRGPTPSFSRASTGTYFNSSGVLTTAAINAPRFNHTFNGTSWVSRGLLVEEQRTNTLSYSEDFSNAYWLKFNSPTITANTSETTSPDGTNSATKVVSATTAETDIYKTGVYSGSAAITFSIYAKAGATNFFGLQLYGGTADFTVNFDLLNGTYNQRTLTGYTGTSISITNVGNGWYRCSLTATNPSVSTGIYIQCCTNSLSTTATTSGNSNYFFGAQLEVGSFGTSYIKSNSGSSTTRSADVCQITGGDFSGFWNGTEGSIACEFDVSSGYTSSAMTIANFYQSSSGWIGFRSIEATSSNVFDCYSGGVQQARLGFSRSNPGISARLSAAFKANDFAASQNGSAVSTDTSGSLPSPTYLELGTFTGFGEYLNGHIARLRYYNKRLPNATLQQLSDPDPTLNLQFALNKTLTPVAGPAPSFSRASTGTYFNASGVLTSASINTPRFDHVYSGGQWVSRGLLIEEQRTNAFQWSEDFSNAFWTKLNSSITTSSGTSPDGMNAANKIADDSTNGTHRIYRGIVGTAGQPCTTSFYLKAGTARYAIVLNSDNSDWRSYAVADLQTGTITQNGVMVAATGASYIGSSITNCGDGWYRVSVSGTNQSGDANYYGQVALSNSATPGTIPSYIGTGSYIYAVMAQMELNSSFPTSYIKTTSSTVTRSADVCQITGTSFNWMWNQGEGSFAVEYDTNIPASVRNSERIVEANDGSDNERITFFLNAANQGYVVTDGGVTQSSLPSPSAVTQFAATKTGAAFKLNDFAVSYDGASASTDTSGTMPSPTKIDIGYVAHISNRVINGHIAKLIYYPARLTNTKLQQLST